MDITAFHIQQRDMFIHLSENQATACIGLGDPAAYADEILPSALFRIDIQKASSSEPNFSGRAYLGIQDDMHFRKGWVEGNTTHLEYFHETYRIAVRVDLSSVPDANVVEQCVTVINEGTEEQSLTHLSSAFVGGVLAKGKKTYDDYKNIKLHYCVQTWEGEGQWRETGLEQAGIYHTCAHRCKASFEIGSNSSFSTGRFFPLLLAEDTQKHQIWYLQLNASDAWQMSAGFMTTGNNGAGNLFLQAGAADQRSNDFEYILRPGESFSAAPAVYGCCQGSLNEAVANLTACRRLHKATPAWSGEMPVFYNDYMNCLWSNPTLEKSLPLIDRAAELGFEGYCIDAGWFTDQEGNWSDFIGDWSLESNRFGDKGFPWLIQYIREKDLLPGVWMEMEVCTFASELGKKPDDWFLCRNGCRVSDAGRWFLDYRNAEVRTHIMSCIDQLTDLGVCFIKNDYNGNISIGADSANGSHAVGLIEHNRAFRMFIDKVRERHPNLIVENCASGAMREDYGTISHFHLQSISDQEDYRKMPSLIIGSSMNLLPEQMGIWSYPYPRFFHDTPEKFEEKCKTQWVDGEETIFNMANGMMGVLYCSGRLDKADEKNFNLIRESVSLYKAWRPFIRQSAPVFLTGMLPFNQSDTWAALGLYKEEEKKMLFTVWRLDSDEENFVLDMGDYYTAHSELKQIYPQKDYDVITRVDDMGKVSFCYPQKYTARVFEWSV